MESFQAELIQLTYRRNQQPTIEISKKLQNQFFEPNSEMWKALELGWPPD